MDPEAIAAILAGAIGVSLVYAGWRGLITFRRSALLCGWGLIILSVPLWTMASSPEFGTLFAIFAVAPFAWVCVTRQSEQRERRVPRPYVKGPGRPTARNALPHVALFMGAVPLAATAAALTAVWGSTFLPVGVVDQMAIGVLVTPVLWGLFAWWVCIARRPWRPLLALTALAAASYALI